MLTRKLMTATAIALGVFAFGTSAQAAEDLFNRDVFVGTVPSLSGPEDRSTLAEIRKVSTAGVTSPDAIASRGGTAQFAAVSLDGPEDRAIYKAREQVAAARMEGPSMAQFAATEVEGLGRMSETIGLRLFQLDKPDLEVPTGQ